MYGQDRRITPIHMLSANKSEYFDIYFSCLLWIPFEVYHSEACITLRTRRDIKKHYSEYRSSVISPKLSMTDMEKYISKHSEMSAQEKCVSSILLPWT